MVPGTGVEPVSHVFQTRAVTTLATLARVQSLVMNVDEVLLQRVSSAIAVDSRGLEPLTFRM